MWPYLKQTLCTESEDTIGAQHSFCQILLDNTEPLANRQLVAEPNDCAKPLQIYETASEDDIIKNNPLLAYRQHTILKIGESDKRAALGLAEDYDQAWPNLRCFWSWPIGTYHQKVIEAQITANPKSILIPVRKIRLSAAQLPPWLELFCTQTKFNLTIHPLGQRLDGAELGEIQFVTSFSLVDARITTTTTATTTTARTATAVMTNKNQEETTEATHGEQEEPFPVMIVSLSATGGLLLLIVMAAAIMFKCCRIRGTTGKGDPNYLSASQDSAPYTKANGTSTLGYGDAFTYSRTTGGLTNAYSEEPYASREPSYGPLPGDHDRK
jgi:hypothetical protein